MTGSRRRILLLSLLLGAASVGCAAPEATPEVAEANLREEARFALRLVVPELEEGYPEYMPRDPNGTLTMQVSTNVGGFIGIGGEHLVSTGPFIGLGRDIYGIDGKLRIGSDLTVYLEFDVRFEPELYCCLGTPKPPQDESGVFRGEAPRIADVGSAGLYVIGRLVGVDRESLRHGTEISRDQLELEEGMTFSVSRRIQRGDRHISIEAARPPTTVDQAPTFLNDRAALDR